MFWSHREGAPGPSWETGFLKEDTAVLRHLRIGRSYIMKDSREGDSMCKDSEARKPV